MSATLDAFHASPHSADVELWLSFAGERIPLHEIGPSFVVPATAQVLPPGDGELEFSIDGIKVTQAIHLVNGLNGEQRDALILALDETAPF